MALQMLMKAAPDLASCVNATARTDRPAGKQVAKYSRYNNGTKDTTTGADRLPGNQVTMYGCYNNRTTTSSILAKYTR